jgi:hypothetical protein
MEKFDELMFEALNDTLRLVLGETVSQLIYSLTKGQPLLQLNETSNSNVVSITYLEKLLGKEGAQIIQTISIKRLCLKLKREYEEVEAHFSFLDELYEMKFKLLAPLLKGKHATHN